MSREPLVTFLRQSGGLTGAIFLAGLASYAVHIFAKEMPKADYGVFTTLLQVLNLVGIPVLGLQAALAQQTSAAQTEADRRQLAATLRAVLRWTFVGWAAVTGVALLFQNQLLAALKITSPGPLWITLSCVLMALWLPIFSGVLQGRQNFLRLGGSILSLGVVRLTSIAVIVGFGAQVAGAMVGVWLGYFAALLIAWWGTRVATDNNPPDRFLWQPWLKHWVPIKFGAGTAIFLMCADMVFVQYYFDDREQTGLYAAAGMIGRALVFLVSPIVMVMFPKVARAAATGEKSGVLFQTLGLTALIAGSAAGFCTLFPELSLSPVYDKSFLPIAPLVPWFAWAMMPLALAGVLNSHLLARKRYAVVPWLVLVAAGYGVALNEVAKRSGTMEPLAGFTRVVQTLGVFNLLFFAVALFFSWRDREQAASKEI